MAIEPTTWQEEIAQNWANVRLAHEGMMLDKIGQQTKRIFGLADAAANGTLGKGQPTEAEDMSVSIGNKIYMQQTPTQPSMMGEAAKKLIPLALAAALGGAAPLAYLWWNQPQSQPVPPLIQPPAASENWQLGIEVVNP